MICKECPEGRRFTEESVNCVHYGMILRADHECKLERGKQLDGAEDNGQDGEDRTEIQDDSCGAA